MDQARKPGKPADIVEKMVEGRLRKFYEEVVLKMQPYVLDPDQKVDSALKEAEEAVGSSVKVKAFVRFRTGEGIERSGANDDLRLTQV
jgi:elongation factor Ts